MTFGWDAKMEGVMRTGVERGMSSLGVVRDESFAPGDNFCARTIFAAACSKVDGNFTTQK